MNYDKEKFLETLQDVRWKIKDIADDLYARGEFETCAHLDAVVDYVDIVIYEYEKG